MTNSDDPDALRETIVRQLQRAYNSDPEYDASTGPWGGGGGPTPDIVVSRSHRVVHLFRVAVGVLSLDDADRDWRAIGILADSLNAPFWLVVPAESLATARALCEEAGVLGRLAVSVNAPGSPARFEWY